MAAQALNQRYDAASLEERGRGRAQALPSRLVVPPDFLRGKRILEVGCGFGEHCAALEDMFGADVIGIDPWPRIQEGPYRERGFFRQLDVTSDDVRSLGEFDIVTSYDTLEHVEDPRRAVANIAALLRPGGRAFLKYNLHRGASASHIAHLIDFPWVHLLHTDDEIRRMIRDKTGRDLGPAWVNKSTYAHYLMYFLAANLEPKRVWYVTKKMTEDFYVKHIERLKPYPREDLDRDFMCVVLRRPKHRHAVLGSVT